MNEFIGQFLNVVFPVSFFVPETIAVLIDTYGEDSNDGGQTVKTLWQRQDTADVNSRRAASPANELPELLNNGKMLVVGIDPTAKIFEAVTSGELPNVEIISDADLPDYLETYRIPQEVE